MKLVKQRPRQALNPAFRRQPLGRTAINLFKKNLLTLLGKIDETESEEHLKNQVRDFLRDTYYKETNEVNTKGRQDLVIHTGKTNQATVGVIIEAKRPKNTTEWFKGDNANCKAFQELVLYYLREREDLKNIDIKYLVATNINEWYIIEASYFEKLFFRNKSFLKQYQEFTNRQKVTTDTHLFYHEIAKPFIDSIDETIPCTYFDIRDFEKSLRNTIKEEDSKLIALYKILSPYHLLRVEFADDSNSLKESFYRELLHIIGLEERKEGSKYIIDRKKEGQRNAGSLIENTITILEAEDPLHKITDLSVYGSTRDERLYNIALELSLTWIIRILFLKLLEGQLKNYHQKNPAYLFLHSEMIPNYDELHKLFHQVLAKTHKERSEAVNEKYERIPYLNSSLFDISKLEDQTLKINQLDNSLNLKLTGNTVLREIRKKNPELPALNYLFRFLNAFDFASEGSEEIQEDENRTLINSSVLGKVFEKINGYKDGSIFTPGFITMYMCRQSIRLAVVQKFKEKYGWNIETFDDIINYLADRKSAKDILEFNALINSLRLCDPAVGSGHYLVSSLNEIIAIKSELGLLADEKGIRLSGYQIVIEQDELIITDLSGNDFKYEISNGKPLTHEMQRVQKTLFHEKQAIIENCLFGVDINPNSVKICGLRLWIELLKNAYYKPTITLSGAEVYQELETLPNIDINIKCGNSLISRFALDADLSKTLKSIKYTIEQYRAFVNEYKNEKNREVKRGLQIIIDSIKNDIITQTSRSNPKKKRLDKLAGELLYRFTGNMLFEPEESYEKKKKDLAAEEKEKLEEEIEKLRKELEEEKSNVIFKNAFEWRFEFPEVMNNDGDFIGFDVVIANPPYIQHRELAYISSYLKDNYKVYSGTSDISSYFFEKFILILKPKGIISVINSNKFFNAEYGKTLRDFLSNYNFVSVINFEQVPIFDEALVSSAIFLITNDSASESFEYTKYFKEKVSTLEETNEIGKRKVFIKQKSLKNYNWLFNDSNSNNIINKIKAKGVPISGIDSLDIKRGITTGFDDAFIINNKTKDELIKEQSKIGNIVKPLLRGKDITKYALKPIDLNLLFIPWHFPLHNDKSINGNSREAEAEFKNSFPSLYNHVEKFKDKLSKRNKDETGIRYEWYALQRCANTYYDDFNKEKIVWGLISGNWGFSLDNKGHFLTSASFFITSKIVPLKFLLALFNSNLFKYYFEQVGEYTAGGAYVLKKTSIEKFIIPTIESKQQQPFIDLVDKILIEKLNGNQDTKSLEDKIDKLVYELYGLTEQEIKIIEGGQ